MQLFALCLVAATFGAAEPEAVVLEFTAPSRCPPCQQIAPLVHRLEREGFPIRAIDVDMNPSAGSKYRLNAVPTFVLLISGREMDRFEGKPSEGELRRMCERARLANVAFEKSPVQHEGDAPTEPLAASQDSKPENKKPEPVVRHSQPASRPPIIRAKNDGTNNFPPITSADPLHVSPRIRVKDLQGVNFGSGTIIESTEGRTTLLTCGHIFRKLDDKSVIEVDVFNGTKHETFVGRAIKYDLEADVGLIWIPTARPLPTAPVAGVSNVPAVGQHVFSVGCGGGEAPSKLQHRVTALNRYLGPDNIECTGVPIQGRSGGGLFDTDGRLVGVCIAADQRDQRGLYAGLKPIHQLLDQVKLSHLLPKAEPRPNSESLAVATPNPSAEEPVFESEPNQTNDQQTESPFTATDEVTATLPSSPTSNDLTPPRTNNLPAPLENSAELQAALDQAGEAEVVCIIRPLKDPRAASRVVIINRASSKFLSQLSGELDQQKKPTTAIVREAKYLAPSDVRPYRRNPNHIR